MLDLPYEPFCRASEVRPALRDISSCLLRSYRAMYRVPLAWRFSGPRESDVVNRRLVFVSDDAPRHIAANPHLAGTPRRQLSPFPLPISIVFHGLDSYIICSCITSFIYSLFRIHFESLFRPVCHLRAVQHMPPVPLILT